MQFLKDLLQKLLIILNRKNSIKIMTSPKTKNLKLEELVSDNVKILSEEEVLTHKAFSIIKDDNNLTWTVYEISFNPLTNSSGQVTLLEKYKMKDDALTHYKILTSRTFL